MSIRDDSETILQPALPPLFISVEGGEGAGKTTFSKALVEALKKAGRKVIHTREPGGTPEGEHFRNFLLGAPFSEEEFEASLKNSRFLEFGDNPEADAFLKIRMEHLVRLIIPALLSDHVVVCERFHDSTVVYQGFAKTGDETDINRMGHYCFNAMKKFTDLYDLVDALPKDHVLRIFSQNHFLPHLTFFLNIAPDEGLRRKEKQGPLDRFERKGLDFHTRVHHGFRLMASKFPERIYTIDALQSTEVMVDFALHEISLKYPDLIYG